MSAPAKQFISSVYQLFILNKMSPLFRYYTLLRHIVVVVVVVINSPNIGTPRIEWNKVKC